VILIANERVKKKELVANGSKPESLSAKTLRRRI
jgi:hypothetical protein